MKKTFFFISFALLGLAANAQLSDGTVVSDFNLYEINKTTGEMISDPMINLYDMLNDYKTVYIDVSATTCSPCYAFHKGGTLESLYNNYGPGSTVNDSRVLFIEGASTGSSWSAINGSAGSNYWDCTHVYNSTNLVPYPVIPLRIAPNYPSYYNSFHSNWSIGYFPTMYMVCPNRMVYNLPTSSSNVATTYHNYAQTRCPAISNSNDAYIGPQTSSKPVYFCEYNFTPVITLQNVGTENLTSATLRVTHGSDVQTTTWTGNLAQFETTQVSLAPVTGTENGIQTFTVDIVLVNGVDDEGNIHNSHSESFNAQVFSESGVASQNFSSSNLYPWTLLDNTDGMCGRYNGTLRFRAYNISNGGKAEFYAPLMNFSENVSPILTFDVAHRVYTFSSGNTSNDRLQVVVSTDCGETWQTVYNKSGSTLATVTTGTGEFNATASQYRTEIVDLSAYANNPSVIVKFVFISNYGNNIFVDNIQITDGPLSAEEINETVISVFPNPVKDVLKVNCAKPVRQIDVFDVNGRLLNSFTPVSGTVHLENLPNGIYMLHVQTEDGTFVRKIVKE